jgi:uncharacterized membrane protein
MPEGDETVRYSVILRPHRSAGRYAARWAAGVVGIMAVPVSAAFFLAGAWPVLPFLGAEVVLLYVLMRLNQRAGNALETINLTRCALTVKRIDHWGKTFRVAFQPFWLQVNIEELPGNNNRLELRSHGRSLIIANFLLPNERIELALALRRELSRLNSTVEAA